MKCRATVPVVLLFLATSLCVSGRNAVAASTEKSKPNIAAEKYPNLINRYRDKGMIDDRVEKVLFKMGLCLMLMEEYAEAGKFFRRFADVLAHSPLRPASLYWAGDGYFKAGQYLEAYQMFKRVVWDYPESKWAKYARGRLANTVFDGIAERE